MWTWGPLHELAYQAYGDPKYAWLLARIEREYADSPGRSYPNLPMSLQSPAGEYVHTARLAMGRPRMQHRLAVLVSVSPHFLFIAKASCRPLQPAGWGWGLGGDWGWDPTLLSSELPSCLFPSAHPAGLPG